MAKSKTKNIKRQRRLKEQSRAYEKKHKVTRKKIAARKAAIQNLKTFFIWFIVTSIALLVLHGSYLFFKWLGI